MTQARRRALWMLGIWGLAAIGFVATFFAAGGPESYAQDSRRILAGAVFLGLAYAALPAMLWLTRARSGVVARDERDERIDGRSSEAALVTVLGYVFVVNLVLWLGHQERGVVPAGWTWFLAYSTVILAYVSRALAALVFDLSMVGHGQG